MSECCHWTGALSFSSEYYVFTFCFSVISSRTLAFSIPLTLSLQRDKEQVKNLAMLYVGTILGHVPHQLCNVTEYSDLDIFHLIGTT